MNNGQLIHLDLYRLPWTLADNAISWLEPTAICNLACDGCPDITVYKDELIWSCRMEEQKQYDIWLRTVPKI